MKAPSIHTVHSIIEAFQHSQTVRDGIWGPSRPEGRYGLLNRLRCAWWVFIGRADAVLWPFGQ